MKTLLIFTIAIVIIRVASAEGPVYNFHFFNGVSEANSTSIVPVVPKNNLVEKIEPQKEKSDLFFALELGADIGSQGLDSDYGSDYAYIETPDGKPHVSALIGRRGGLALRVGIGMGHYQYEGDGGNDYADYGDWDALEFSVGLQKEIRMGKYFSLLAGLNYRWMSSEFNKNWDSGDMVNVSTSLLELSVGPQVNFGKTIYLNLIAGVGQKGGEIDSQKADMTSNMSLQLNLGIRM